MPEDLKTPLEANFGHTSFRPLQEEIIRQVLDGQDTLGVLPTGAGKSLCYQLPALLLPRPTLVISPLIALMQDQLDGLPPSVYPMATLINSSLDQAEVNNRLRGIESGAYRLIYAAPERLRQLGFLRLLQRINPSMVVVDESHCVSVWGHDFRPDYLFIRKALEMLEETGKPPILLALTATATMEMRTEICHQLGRNLAMLIGSVFRSNLQLEVVPCTNSDAKMRRLATLCREIDGPGIIYANSRDRCEQVARMLSKQGVKATFYHAGLDRDLRKSTQENFMLGRTRVMVATVAFGMGVDKSNVRFVIHFTMPESLESYTQEAGRAGRDGKPSRCLLMIAPGDKSTLSRWLRQNHVSLEDVRETYRALKARIGHCVASVSPREIQFAVFGDQWEDAKNATKLRVAISILERCGLLRRHLESGYAFHIEIPAAPVGSRKALDGLLETRSKHEERRLSEMIGYAEGIGCRQAAIAHHFDQDLNDCGDACDNCLGTAQRFAVARPVAPTYAVVPDIGRVIVQCIASLPYPLGRTGVAKVVTGAADSSVASNRCVNFGVLAGFTLKAVRAFLDSLVEQKLLLLNLDSEYPILNLTQNGRSVLLTNHEILANPLKPSANVNAHLRPNYEKNDPIPVGITQLSVDEDERFERLRAWRRIEASHQKLPPFIIFHDSTLRNIAHVNPANMQALAQISGLGERKLALYGAAILELFQRDADPE